MVLLHNPVDLDGGDSDGDDSISLCDLPTAASAADSSEMRSDGRPFEFLSAAKPEMCAADDVIFAGKLLPFGAHRPPPPEIREANLLDFPNPDHRRSTSLGEQPPGCWGGKHTGCEYRKLKSISYSDPGSDLKGAAPDPRRPRPRWYILDFGPARVPSVMELSDIRTRRRRRGTPPRARDPGESGGGGPWRLLRSLSCKGMEAVVVS